MGGQEFFFGEFQGISYLNNDRFVKKILLPKEDDTLPLLGKNDENLRVLESYLDIKIIPRGNELILTGHENNVLRGEKVINNMMELVDKGYMFHNYEIRAAVRLLTEDDNIDLKEIFLDNIPVPLKKKHITPKTLNQKRYIDAIRRYDAVIGIGPAGTGKTYLAMAMAVSAMINKDVSRIILTRPAVEAGEKLGFLPGDIYEKVHPYLRPLYDALYDMMEAERVTNLIERGAIEIAPLAYMRGRTLNDSFIILDEAQNTTSEQMKMFLTRLGFSSKMVITGDITQVDLPSGRASGLIEVQNILKNIEGIKFIYFTEKDVVRHDLVQQIIKAYEEYIAQSREFASGNHIESSSK